ncbi:peroxidase family protein [Tardiphaga sp. 839_C3_N1_4]|uniref:peroxidase family protein n=1 Tax=Tardiphaga sp. 839_C3_N1_4 TaxID=3240761 RepID=UPI003F283D82
MANYLKPFNIDQTDIDFILSQVNFRPLFDAHGNAVILWNGTGSIYDAHGNLIGTGGALAGDAVSLAAIAQWGQSYYSEFDFAGLRDPSGLNNNLSLINSSFGAVDQIFTRSAAADYAGYSSVMQAVADRVYAAAKTYYSSYSAATGGFNPALNGDYTIKVDTTPGQPGDHTASDGTPIEIQNVVDYTPRMISLTTTTAGVSFDTWANHTGDAGATAHQPNEIYYDPSTGEAKVLNWGLLSTVADGGLGQVDTQARLAASAGQDDHFIGGLNPGVSPSNGFFVLFGQFFDHGLDFIGKASGQTIKIALASDDPLYGMLGPDGRPVHEITVSRATVATVDANGAEYINHTSPFIDQSQTYGSHEQLTNLLREWVKDPASGQYHAGMNLFDGQTLETAWTKADGSETHNTLPTLDELRAHVDATGRDALTWEDVNDLRNRDAGGHVIAGTSSSALLLDMNPRFDAGHMGGFYDLDGNGAQNAGEASYGTAAQAAKVAAAIASIDAYAKANFGAGSSFGIDAGTHKLTLIMENLPPGTPTGTPHSLNGASALFPFVNFADFSITVPAGALHDAVGEILMASVGDHYVAGDGRVNENFGLTSIHHVFHEEHNYQIDNIIDALHRQDIVSADPTHAALHGFQIDTGNGTNAAGDYLDGTGAISWDQDKMFNAAKLVVEMEYQHAAVDQYARNVSPNIQEFGAYSTEVDSAISLEYSQAAFRFGHSTLRETIDTIDPSGGLTGKIMGYALKAAFLAPDKFADVGPSAIILGMSHQQMNEVDEFVTPALNQGLLDQPLDLAAINIARGRDLGIPTLNDVRHTLGYSEYTSWNDFGQNMQHPSSLANFIAAYAFDGDLAKAEALVGIVDGSVAAGTYGISLDQAYGFMNGDEAVGGAGTLAFNQIDTWLGGLAEIHQPGGLLGETFDRIFVDQIEKLMDGDRFYYLYRLFGTNFGDEIVNGQLKDMVERNTGLTHLNGNIFGYADQYVDLGAHKEVLAAGQTEYLTTGNEHKYGDIAAVDDGTMGIYSNGGHGNLNDGKVVTIGGVHYIQDTRLADTDPNSAYNLNGGVNLDGTPNSGAESNEIIVGSKGADLIYAQGGDDTVYGDAGNDKIYGGYGIDRLYGGDGVDTIYGGDNPDLIDGGAGDDFLYGESSGTDINGLDQVIGGAGNDYINGGIGIDKLFGGSGDDIMYGEQDTDPFFDGNDGNDYMDGGSGTDMLYGNNGDDMLLDGTDVDISFGQAGDDWFKVGDIAQALSTGPDEILGGDGITDDGNKPGTIGFDIMDFSLQHARPVGVAYDLDQQANPLAAVNSAQAVPAAFEIEGLVGSVSNDTLGGDAGDNWIVGGSGSDILTGDAGDDVIVGGSIRLDTLIGRYESAPGVASTYDHNNNNDGSTDALRLQDALYQGASHRVGYQDTLGAGLLANADLGTQGFDKHFTEMLRTEFFKDVVLGDGGADATTAAQPDIALFTGQYSDYRIEAVSFESAHEGRVTAYKVTDLRDPNGVDANGTPVVTGGTDLVVGVELLRFSDRDVSLLNSAPVLDLHAYNVSTATVADNFNSPSWSNNDGSQNWASAWTETNDGGVTTGKIQIDAGAGGGNNQLRLSDNGNGTSSIQRTIDLSGAASATLQFTYQLSSYDAGDKVVASISFDGGTSWHEMRTIVGNSTSGNNANNNGGFGTVQVDLGTLKGAGETFGANAIVKFDAVTSTSNQAASGANAASLNNGYVAIDNLSVAIVKQSPDSDLFPNYTTTFTEGGSAATIALNPTITDDGTVIHSAKVVLTNAKAGDSFNTHNIGGDNISIATVGSAPGTITLNLTGDDTLAHYQAQLAAITFSNSSNAPDPADRIVKVTVNDGLIDSNVATTTIHVVPVNDAPAIGADHVYTNVGNVVNGIVVPDWALLANDSDTDGPNPLAVTGVGNPNSLSATHASGVVTVTDSGTSGNPARPNGGSFSYTVTDGLAASSGTVTVTEVNGTSITGSNGNDILVGGANADTLNGGRGNDLVFGGGGDDTINWSVTNPVKFGNITIIPELPDGHDVVDGGTNGAAGDRFVVTGNNTAETFAIYSNTDDWDGAGSGTGSSAAHAGFTGLNANTEIVVARNGVVIAELDNVEEITVNTLDVTANNGNGVPDGGATAGDTVQVVGNFAGSSLNYNTITVNGGGGSDTVDISGLMSDHRIVFHGGGGGDHVLGTLRPQDVVDTQTSPPAGDQSGASGSGQGDLSDDGHNGTSGEGGDHCSSGNGDHGGADTPVPPAVNPGVAEGQIGTSGADVMIGTAGDDTLSALDGDDVIIGNEGADTLKAGAGDDLLKAGAGDDVVFGNDGNDDLFGGAGRDLITGDAGDDRLFGDAGDDALEGGVGNDTVYGGAGNDRIIATVGDGNDTYFGDDGEDTLDYAAIAANITADLGNGIGQHGSVSSVQGGTDQIFGFEDFIGGSGNDTIVASSAANVMDGGAGNDTFVFGSAADANGDTIKGFQPGDKIDLSAIDANTGASGTQSFVLFAGNVFTAAGQVIVTQEVKDGAEHTFVSGNTNGDATADFKIDLGTGNHTLTSADFNGVH